MGVKNKKANGAAIVLGIIVVIFAVIWLYNLAARECGSDSECGTDRYCGSDFKCHDMRIVEKTIVQNDYSRAAMILGAAIIIAAFILKDSGIRDFFRRFKPKKKEEEKQKKTEEFFYTMPPPSNYAAHTTHGDRHK